VSHEDNHQPEQQMQKKKLSRGSRHGALVSKGMAAAEVRRASKIMAMSTDPNQNAVRTVFSSWGRGRNRHNTRHV